jgi:hypothetical protein
MSKRWNRFWIGLVPGALLPVAFFAGIYFTLYAHMPVGDYIGYTLLNQTLPKLMSLCVVPNLLLFYLFLNKEYWYATRGVMTSTLLCIFVVLAVKVFF